MSQHRFRKCWWEQNKVTKEYIEGYVKKYELFGRPFWMIKLPRDFTCFHFGKTVPIEERHHFGLVIALAQPRGALEYRMLEVDRAILRRAK